MAKTSTFLALMLGVAMVVAVLGYLFYLEAPHLAFGASPSGTTFTDSKSADISVNLGAPGANATSSSILNTDLNNRYITSEKVLCTGVGTSQTAYSGTGLASLTITVATTSTAAPATNANTNTLPVMTVATSTAQFEVSSSTAGTPGTGLVSNLWLPGSYLTFTANATNTATCIVGVNYSGS